MWWATYLGLIQWWCGTPLMDRNVIRRGDSDKFWIISESFAAFLYAAHKSEVVVYTVSAQGDDLFCREIEIHLS